MRMGFWEFVGGMLMALGIVGAAYLVGCHSPKQDTYRALTPPSETIRTPERVRRQQEMIDRGQKKAVWAGQLVTGLTRENVDTTKPQLQAAIGVGPGNTFGVTQDFNDLAKSNGQLVLSVKTDVDHAQQVEKENTALKDAERNSQKATLRAWGFWFLVPSLIVLIIAFALPFVPNIGPVVGPFTVPAKIIAAAGVAVGLALLTLATFIIGIEIAIAIAGGIAFVVGAVLLVIWLIRYARNANFEKKRVVDSIDKGVEAGQIILTDAARDPKRSIISAVQGDQVKASVDKIQAERRKKQQAAAKKRALATIKGAVPPPHPSINLATPPAPPAPQPDLRPINLHNPLDVAANGNFNVPAKPIIGL